MACVDRWFQSNKFKARSCPKCRQNPLVSDDEFKDAEAEAMHEAQQANERTVQGNPGIARETGNGPAEEQMSVYYWHAMSWAGALWTGTMASIDTLRPGYHPVLV